SSARYFLSCRLERAGRVADDGGLAGGPDDGDDVEAGGRLGDAVAREVVLGGLLDLLLLLGIDLLLGRRVVVGAGLHFDEDEGLALAGDDVDLAEVAAEVAH